MIDVAVGAENVVDPDSVFLDIGQDAGIAGSRIDDDSFSILGNHITIGVVNSGEAFYPDCIAGESIAVG